VGRRRRLAGTVALAAGLAAVPATRAFQADAAPSPSPLPIELQDPLPVEPSVKDPVFAILIGVLDSEGYGQLTRERLEEEIRRLRAKSRLPYQKVASVSRRALEPGRTAEVTLRFLGPFKASVPYSILGYHPGHVEAAPACRFREWYLGEVTLGARGARFDEVRLFALEEGRLFVDVDGWLDFLAGRALDDTSVKGLAVLRQGERRFGLAFGVNKQGQLRSGVLDFRSDKVLFPAPPELKGVAGELRRRAEELRGAPPGATEADRPSRRLSRAGPAQESWMRATSSSLSTSLSRRSVAG
jgi:hypothetical protein